MAMDVHVKDLTPELELLRKLKYGINEIVKIAGKNQDMNILFQQPISIEKIDYLIDDQPYIEKYKKD